MKLLLIILTIYTSIYGNNISTNSNYNNGYNSLFPEQTRRIGYTTNYSNGQFNSGVYKSSTTSSSCYEPRKSPEKPDPDNDWLDWWHMNMPDILGGNSDWPSYVDPEHWDWFLENYGDEYGEYVEGWFEQHQDAPNNPYKNLPLGPPGTLIPFIFIYVIYKKKRSIS